MREYLDSISNTEREEEEGEEEGRKRGGGRRGEEGIQKRRRRHCSVVTETIHWLMYISQSPGGSRIQDLELM